MTDKIHNGWEIIFACAMESSITVRIWQRRDGRNRIGVRPSPGAAIGYIQATENIPITRSPYVAVAGTATLRPVLLISNVVFSSLAPFASRMLQLAQSAAQ